MSKNFSNFNSENEPLGWGWKIAGALTAISLPASIECLYWAQAQGGYSPWPFYVIMVCLFAFIAVWGYIAAKKKWFFY